MFQLAVASHKIKIKKSTGSESGAELKERQMDPTDPKLMLRRQA